MVKNKKSDKGLEKIGLGSSIFLFMISWIGFIATIILVSSKTIQVINGPTIKGIFFLPLYFVLCGLYGLMTFVFATNINRIKKKERLKNDKKKKG